MKRFFGESFDLIRVAAAGMVYHAAIIAFRFIDASYWVRFAVFGAICVFVGFKTIIGAFKEIKEEPFNEDMLMLTATVGAFALSEFAEGVAVMLFFAVGELFEDYAERRSERAIERLYEMMSEVATVIYDSKPREVAIEDVAAGDELLVRSGERVAADGVLLSDEAFFDTSMITGESKPKRFEKGESVKSGYLAVGRAVSVRAERTAALSSAAKIIELIKEAEGKKAKSEKFITKFARIYTPVVIALAFVVALVPSFITGEYALWIKRALGVLVISCPCALVVSVPIAFFAGVGKAFERGVVLRGSSALERVNRADVFVFDKTGTLTEGSFEVKSVYPEEQKEEILKIAASLEKYSAHPVAKAITSAYCGETYEASEVREIPSNGLIARLFGKTAVAGSEKFVNKNGYAIKCDKAGDTVVCVAYGDVVGYITVGDRVRDGAKELIAGLNAEGKKTVMLTGDNAACASAYAAALGVVSYSSELSPEDKVKAVENLKKQGTVMFAGDGINDAPVIAAADVSVAMGSGSDVAADCADVVLTDDDVKKLSTLRRISKRTMRVVYANIFGSIAVKAALFIMSVFGFVPMWLAVFGDVGVMILATVNSFGLSLGKNF